MTIAVIDYGVGNIHSAMKALRRFHDDVILTHNAVHIRDAGAIVLPGVGAFAAGMEGLEKCKLTNVVRERATSGVPMLGICLGAQILLSKGFEYGEYEGLGIIPGTVEHFPSLAAGYKTPHIGWNTLDIGEHAPRILGDLGQNPMTYFVHSFIMKPQDPGHILATTEYGGCRFASVIHQNNTYGCQFHPEKSAHAGLKIIENFVRLALQ
jgi:glutamine amidotransferase